MLNKLTILFICSVLALNCNPKSPKQEDPEIVDKIEMNLSAFGVESDGYPSIAATIDLKNDTSYCSVSYYDPKYKPRIYRLTKKDMDSVRRLIAHVDPSKLQNKYKDGSSDQPTATTIFFWSGAAARQLEISDYGLEAPSPLKELYQVVYKLDENFKN